MVGTTRVSVWLVEMVDLGVGSQSMNYENAQWLPKEIGMAIIKVSPILQLL